MIQDLVRSWRWMAFRAVAAILFGVATLVWPQVTLLSLVLLWGAFALADGAFTLAAVIMGYVMWHRGWWTVVGLTGIAAGIVTFVWPSITALALLYVIAGWALVTGVVEITTAIRLREMLEHEWALGIAGVASVALAVLLVVKPGPGALAITWVIGWYALLFGGMLSAAAWELRRAEQALQASGGNTGVRAPRHAT